MGSFATLYVADFEVFVSKNSVDSHVMTVFSEADKRVRWRDADSGAYIPGEEDGADLLRELDYCTSVANACHRLDVMGFTMTRCRAEYERIRADEIASLREVQEEVGDDMTDFYTAKIARLERLDFETFREAFAAVMRRNVHYWDDLPLGQIAAIHPLAGYLLADDHEEWPEFGFFCRDIRDFLRMVLSVAASTSELRYDLEDVADSGWIDADAPIRDDAVRQLLERYPENAPRILITEGSSDAAILQKSLRLLFPHLDGYYTFFDFQSARAPGGASQLVAAVKAFAAAGVANRVIAVFDNDTAAHDALRALRGIELPANIAVVHYPSRPWLGQYPTLGPSGEIVLDVNGRAGSVEMYLGRDVLELNGSLCRVQWAGYSQAMSAYQGELIDKAGALERWHRKADQCLTDPALLASTDWVDLRAIWERIFGAFDGTDVLA